MILRHFGIRNVESHQRCSDLSWLVFSVQRSRWVFKNRQHTFGLHRDNDFNTEANEKSRFVNKTFFVLVNQTNYLHWYNYREKKADRIQTWWPMSYLGRGCCVPCRAEYQAKWPGTTNGQVQSQNKGRAITILKHCLLFKSDNVFLVV